MAKHAHTPAATLTTRRRAARQPGSVLDRRLPALPIPATTRIRIERDIDHLIALLDALDGDPDVEDDDLREPSDAVDDNGLWLTTVHGGMPL